MNSLIYRSCHNGIIESGDYWNQQGLEHHSCTHSSTELFDSTADLNTSRSTKDETFSRLVVSPFIYFKRPERAPMLNLLKNIFYPP